MSIIQVTNPNEIVNQSLANFNNSSSNMTNAMLRKIQLDREFQLQQAQAQFFKQYAGMLGGMTPGGSGTPPLPSNVPPSPASTSGVPLPNAPYYPGVSRMAGNMAGLPGSTPSIAGIPMTMTGANVGGLQMGLDPLAMQQAKTNITNQGNINLEQGKNLLEASKSLSRDKANLDMLSGAAKDLYTNYKNAVNNGLGGNFLNSMKFKAMKSGIMPIPEGTDVDSAGRFIASRNELITKMQPILSQQFGKDGSSRIMESLLQLAGKEIPDLNTPPAVARGQIAGTVRSMYRFLKGSQDYAKQLGIDTKQLANLPNSGQIVDQIWNNPTANMSPKEEDMLNKTMKNIFGSDYNSGNSISDRIATILHKRGVQ